MGEDLKPTNQPSSTDNKSGNKFNWRLVLGISVIAALIVAALFYIAYLSFYNRKTTNTTDSGNKVATKSAEKNSTPTSTKKDTETSEKSTTIPQEYKLIITEKDFGQFFAISNGQQVFLRLSNKYSWIESEPKTTGAITLIRVNYENDPGYREWQVNYTTSSTATIESNIQTGTLGTDAEITRFFINLKIQNI